MWRCPIIEVKLTGKPLKNTFQFAPCDGIAAAALPSKSHSPWIRQLDSTSTQEHSGVVCKAP
ncbi:MAG: hypothetical protein WCH21_12825 [Bacteroidota bacterium]